MAKETYPKGPMKTYTDANTQKKDPSRQCTEDVAPNKREDCCRPLSSWCCGTSDGRNKANPATGKQQRCSFLVFLN
ncbi:hypothetical protein T265_04009 [Opisthorchis viverrini]|uniref:Uncharacterized protein n=1 Tax=Opisthorchis viverrini TaxID=6198 RepID=A0A075A1B9_OPIVI|nr:hypothetical protein T265_04009 [Opisthorchis viverrini]KER29350.1 hypothetical protein T265_04009 [Opisthorchis viverrini]